MMRTMPNERPNVATVMRHILDLPPCCPVSGNPQPGSTLTIRYCPAATVLEVYGLAAHIKRFIGGSPDGIRNMETMIQQIALDCAAMINVPVSVRADLVLDTQQLTMTCRYDPTTTQTHA
jgi:NADPH-dependent 7-cyano-7-deazaguanine reductase QueF